MSPVAKSLDILQLKKMLEKEKQRNEQLKARLAELE